MNLAQLPESFEWTHEPWGLGLRCRPLSAVAPHVFSTRQLSFPSSGGERHLVQAIGAVRLATAHQVHEAGVFAVGRTPPTPEPPRADILVSDVPDTGVAVRAADCAPILIAARSAPVVAAVHAGWRGTAAGAVSVAVATFERDYGVRASDLVVAIGPCIGACCYTVGSELVDAFAAAGHARHLIDRWFMSPPPPRGSRERPALRLNIELANRDQLILAGVNDENIHATGLCTAMHLDVLTSFRAEQAQATRLVGAIRPCPECLVERPGSSA